MADGDPVDVQILDLLGRDGRMSNREIGRRIGISEYSARSRIKKLQAQGNLRYYLMIDRRISSELSGAYIAVKCRQATLRETASRLAALPGCSFCAISVGEYNIMTYFLTSSRDRLYEIIRGGIEPLEGIVSLSVREVLRVAKHPLQMK